MAEESGIVIEILLRFGGTGLNCGAEGCGMGFSSCLASCRRLAGYSLGHGAEGSKVGMKEMRNRKGSTVFEVVLSSGSTALFRIGR